MPKEKVEILVDKCHEDICPFYHWSFCKIDEKAISRERSILYKNCPLKTKDYVIKLKK